MAQKTDGLRKHLPKHSSYVAFLLPVILAAAYLNMGQSSCGGGGSAQCQGKTVTHTFSTTGIATNDDDVIRVTAGDIYVLAEGGNDTICVVTSEDGVIVLGGPGDDSIAGGSGSDTVYGESGNDSLYGNGGVDFLRGGLGEDYLAGGPGTDNLRGEEDNDLLEGGDDPDVLVGGDGDDIVAGEDGDDILVGGPGADYLDGGSGDDLMGGDEGDDVAVGGEGNDQLFGGAGNDSLSGGPGADRLEGNGQMAGTIDGGSGQDRAVVCFGGPSVTSVESIDYDDPLCPVEAAPVISARLEIDVGNCSRYGSGPEEAKILPYFVSINDEPEEQFLGDRYSQPVFKVGETYIHDFLIAGTVNDVRKITIRNVNANDDSCLSRIRLGVNHFLESPAQPHWLFRTGRSSNWIYSPPNAGSELTFTFDDLRSNPNWTVDNVDSMFDVLGSGIDYATLTRYLEHIVLQAIQGQQYNPRPHHTPEWVAVCSAARNECNAPVPLPTAPNVARGWLILSVDVPVNLRDWASLKFDLEVACGDEDPDDGTNHQTHITITPSNFDAFADGIGTNIIERELLGALGGLGDTLTQAIDLMGLSCAGWTPQFDSCGLWFGVNGAPNPVMCQ